MEDHEIVQLYWERNQDAISATSEKYGAYCSSIARNILATQEDAEECVNDTYLNAWNAIPPNRPRLLPAFLGKITRNLAFNRYRRNMAAKRCSGEFNVVLEELKDCVSSSESVEQVFARQELLAAVNDFLASLPKEKRCIFLCRYWYADSTSDIAARFGMKDGAVSMSLNRTRKKLQQFLSERGFEP